MKVKKVNRYSCDFCKKRTFTAHSMRKHEEHCTMNPDRKCGMCRYADHDQPVLKDLIVVLPVEGSNYEWFGEAVNDALPKLREAAANCPACIMAALRQAKIPVPMVDDFKFKDECEAFLAEHSSEDGQYYREAL